ncbi:MAG: hypothetical protein Q4D26_05305 [Clostridia bacterium]|nr:hypothetical protein [Clostridia bacterium]
MKYKEIMDKIYVTPEMQKRILNNVNKEIERKYSSVAIYYKTFVSVAACAVIVMGVLSVYNIMTPSVPHDFETAPPLASPYSSEGFFSEEELSKAVGYDVKSVNYLPFKPTNTEYYNIDDMAEIYYSNDKDALTFRMSRGSSDISGYYNVFSNEKTIGNVTIKGDGNMYSLAIWSADGFSYSIDVTAPVSQETILNIVNSVK